MKQQTSAFSIVMVVVSSDDIVKFQGGVKTQKEAMKRRWKRMMNQLVRMKKDHEDRLDAFSHNGRIHYSAFYASGPTIVDRIRLELFTRYSKHDNRTTNHVYRVSRRYKARFFRIFGAWTLQYGAVKFFMHFTVLCTLTMCVYVCMCVVM